MEIRSVQYDILDDGFVRLDNFMGGDLAVVNHARISYDKYHRELQKGDEQLIHFLMKHRHGTPFESSVFTFHIRAPIFVVREWQRHRIASYNEISGRYVRMENKAYVPGLSYIRTQVGKPGRYTFEPIEDKDTALRAQILVSDAYDKCFELYDELLKIGCAKEVARIVLPLGLYTEFFCTLNARSLMNFISLRNADNALQEIRDYAKILEAIFAERMPITHEAFAINDRVAP